ncbi:MAG: gliding motility-associated C-terminal domain-containing protein [Cyclobacteriaceae bacterium]|nr:hypothetical protein [Cytophagales bacterium]HNP76462.1 gliding motility-associated C-terminal domain-containing protein [Cyclobacteriaceae bacterium]
MAKRILLLLLILLPFLGKASHIVGGEFELIHLNGYNYRLNMILYFDVINGAPGANDPFVDVRIFRMSDNFVMTNLRLLRISETNVDYTQPECSHGELITSKKFYSVDIVLPPELYNDPAGYYVAYERCCRNYNITNIFSEDPTRGPVYAGQTFYLEFPPVIKDGQQFIDSTPRLFPPLNDFGCPRRPYYTDFGGTDDDGDSLVYSLTAPLNTKSADALPPGGFPRPRPYPEVTFRAPYTMNNIVGGNPDLRISRDGFLTVSPGAQGLFAFAVKVEEYRNKVKIGETRRDFQMLVVDACPKAQPPSVVGKKLTDASFSSAKTMDVFFANTVTDGQRCINVRVSDPDSQSPDDSFQERIKIKAFALNFKKDLSGILPTVTTATLINGSTADFTICFPQCPFFYGGAAQIGIIAMDDACSLPLTDTLKINLTVEPPTNQKPVITSPTPVNATLLEGTQAAWPYAVTDPDGDPLVISVLTNGFLLSTAGMTFNTISNLNGVANGELKWDAYCNIYDFTKRNAFQVTVQVEDQDKCNVPNPQRAVYNLNVILPGNASPTIDTDLTPAVHERRVAVTRRMTEALSFNVVGKDLVDNDNLVLSLAGADFAVSDLNIKPDLTNAAAKGTVGMPFTWNITCNSVDLKKKDTYDFRFIVVDNQNKCRFYKADTVDVVVTVLPPVNNPPQLTVINKATASVINNGSTLPFVLGGNIDLTLTGFDVDNPKDNMVLDLIKASGSVSPSGYTFSKVTGTSPIQTTFSWTPDCSIFAAGKFENDYSFLFRLQDDHCLTAKRDSVVVKLKIKDVDGSDANFNPPNFFSPNGDNLNDYFAMEAHDPITGVLKNILPNDNCYAHFEGVQIMNRWGTEVFSSQERNFRWYGNGESGVFFYFIRFSHKVYKGTVTVTY